MSRDLLRIDVVTIFPSMLSGFLSTSIIKRAIDSGIVDINPVNLRDFAVDKHRSTDDRPYGGGSGMVMTPLPFFRAVDSLRREDTRVILLCPQGELFNQKKAWEFSKQKHLILLCGHYEGVDERVRLGLATDEISIGDYVLSNGTLAAMVLIDAVVRLIPGALGDENAVYDDSFSQGLLEYPQYTRPFIYRGMHVPEILASGNHKAISKWRNEQSFKRTKLRRPDILKRISMEVKDDFSGNSENK